MKVLMLIMLIGLVSCDKLIVEEECFLTNLKKCESSGINPSTYCKISDITYRGYPLICVEKK